MCLLATHMSPSEKCLWIKNLWYIYAIEHYSAIKKNKIMSFVATWMELDFRTKWSTSERQRRTTYMWNLKYGRDEPTYKTETDHGHGEQTCGCQGWAVRERDGQGVWGWWIQTVTFGTDGQCALTVHTGNCVWLGHSAVQQKLKKHCKSTIL